MQMWRLIHQSWRHTSQVTQLISVHKGTGAQPDWFSGLRPDVLQPLQKSTALHFSLKTAESAGILDSSPFSEVAEWLLLPCFLCGTGRTTERAHNCQGLSFLRSTFPKHSFLLPWSRDEITYRHLSRQKGKRRRRQCIWLRRTQKPPGSVYSGWKADSRNNVSVCFTNYCASARHFIRLRNS